MELIDKEKAASVALVHLRVSEDELAVYEAALSHALDTLATEEIERRFGASSDAIEGMRDDLQEVLSGISDTPRPDETLAKVS